MTERAGDQHIEQLCQPSIESAESVHASVCKMYKSLSLFPRSRMEYRMCVHLMSPAGVSGVRSSRSPKKGSKVIEQWVLLKYILASFRDAV